ncbi:hypothetical protein P7C70_g4066, partial [Phenoliferia sp. Uapishka_3]
MVIKIPYRIHYQTFSFLPGLGAEKVGKYWQEIEYTEGQHIKINDEYGDLCEEIKLALAKAKTVAHEWRSLHVYVLRSTYASKANPLPLKDQQDLKAFIKAYGDAAKKPGAGEAKMAVIVVKAEAPEEAAPIEARKPHFIGHDEEMDGADAFVGEWIEQLREKHPCTQGCGGVLKACYVLEGKHLRIDAVVGTEWAVQRFKIIKEYEAARQVIDEDQLAVTLDTPPVGPAELFDRRHYRNPGAGKSAAQRDYDARQNTPTPSLGLAGGNQLPPLTIAPNIYIGGVDLGGGGGGAGHPFAPANNYLGVPGAGQPAPPPSSPHHGTDIDDYLEWLEFDYGGERKAVVRERWAKVVADTGADLEALKRGSKAMTEKKWLEAGIKAAEFERFYKTREEYFRAVREGWKPRGN